MYSDAENDKEYIKEIHTKNAIRVAELISQEYLRARVELGFGKMLSFHEGYAILLEELDELWDEIKAKDPNREAIKREATQVGAMAMAFIAELLLDD